MRKRKGLMSVLFALVVLGGMAAGSQAGIVQLSITGGGGNWQAYAAVPSEYAGLSSIPIDVTADSGLAITSSTNMMPHYFSFLTGRNVGFQMFMSNGTNGIGIMGGQPSAYGLVPDPLADAQVIQGVGQVGGTSGPAAFPANLTWTAPVLLAQGTYSGAVGWLHVRVGTGQFNVLNKVNAGPWVGPGNVSEAQGAGADLLIPEPATMLLVVSGAVAMVIRRRR